MTDNQESHLRLDWLNFRDYAIFIKGIGFFIDDEVPNVDEFKLNFSLYFVFYQPISIKNFWRKLELMKNSWPYLHK